VHCAACFDAASAQGSSCIASLQFQAPQAQFLHHLQSKANRTAVATLLCTVACLFLLVRASTKEEWSPTRVIVDSKWNHATSRGHPQRGLPANPAEIYGKGPLISVDDNPPQGRVPHSSSSSRSYHHLRRTSTKALPTLGKETRNSCRPVLKTCNAETAWA
jgi:hypothetical protein